MTLRFALLHAARSLMRERQRSLLAITCIAFGVLSLVSMQLLSASVQASMAVAPALALGGNARIAPAGRPFDGRDAAALRALQQRGVLGQVSALAPSQGNLVRREGAARGYFVMRAFGVDAGTYPIAGEIELIGGSANARDVLSIPGAVIVTRDLARKLHVRTGDRILLSGEPGAPPARLVVGAVARSLPDRRGDTMLYGLETAALIGARPDVVQSALVTLSDPADTLALRREGWSVTTAVAAAAQGAGTAELFGTMLKGAGLLGLLVGGVGVANTLQVVLARRTPEIAALKTLGYQQSHLLLLFALETAFLGFAGSVLGVATAVLAGMELTRLMSGMESALLLEFAAPVEILAGGVAIGMVTALVFGLHAIVRTSAVRPAVLLRDLPVVLDARGRTLIALLHAVLLLTIFVISAVVLGSALRGLGLAVLAAVGLLAVGGTLSLVLRAVLLIPVRGLGALARRNLARQTVRSAFALTALFAGVFSIAMAATVFMNGRDRVLARTLDVSGEDLFIYGDRSDSLRIRRVLGRFGSPREYVDVRATTLRPLDAGAPGNGPAGPGRGAAASGHAVTLRGVTDMVGVNLVDAESFDGKPVGAEGVRGVHGRAWSAADEVVLPVGLADSARSVIVDVGGETIALRVAGRYEPGRAGGMNAAAVLIPIRTALRLAGDSGGSGVWSVPVPVERLGGVSDAVARSLPDVMVVSPADFRDFLNRVYRGLFRFVAGVSALALLAGVVLIANAVGLSLVERRRELGVLKALGYGRRHIVAVIALENGVLGCVGGAAGVAGAYGAIGGINGLRPQAELSLDPSYAAVLIAVAITLAVATALAVAWRTTGLRPLVVLREE